MTTVVNPKTVSWTNPTEGTDQNGAQVAWSAATDLGGIEIQIDNVPVASVPVSLGATSASLTAINVYQTLAAGSHSLALAVVTKEGVASQFSSTTPFQIAVVPLAPTNPVLD